MAGVNKVIIVGHLGNDPEIRTMPNGDAVANISVATSESWNDRNTGERREVTEWHRIVFYRRQAEICGEYLRKGSQIYVEGRLRTRKWQDQNGQDRYTTEIQGDVMQMLGSRNQNAGGYAASDMAQSAPQPSYQSRSNNNFQSARPTAQQTAPQPEAPMDGFDDDIPF